MSDTFREPTPGEIQNALLQFMGQNLGEIKKLDGSIVAKNPTLQGMTLNPRKVLQTVPSSPTQPSPIQQPVAAVPVAQTEVTDTQLTATPPATHSVVPATDVPPDDPNQMLFDFINDLQKTPSVIAVIQSIDKKTNDIWSLSRSVSQLEGKVDKLIEDLKVFKKKVKEVA